MRMIDADEAIINFGFEWDDIPPTREEFVYFLKKQPTIDAVTVVRCLDCKHSDAECHKDGLRYCMRGIKADDYNETGYVYPLEVVIRDDDFCSYGERKEGEE